MTPRTFLLVSAGALVAACAERAPAPSAEAPPAEPTEATRSCDAPGVRAVAERLGTRLKEVPLLAPDSVVAQAIRTTYASLVTPDLLAGWVADPARAPGRRVSSPWPERIEVHRVEPAGEGACRVEGVVIYVTSVEQAGGGAAAQEPVTMQVREEDGAWRISAYEVVSPEEASPEEVASPEEAVAVLRRYYAAIATRDFRRAYALWGDGGAASGQTFAAFADGFAETARVEAEVGVPGRVEGAAGSRYVEVPVTVRAVTRSGEAQRFEGTYTLRRTVADGATEAQRRWHLYTADVTRVR